MIPTTPAILNHEQYEIVMACIEQIAPNDPHSDTALGSMFLGLVEAVEAYEETHYPQLCPHSTAS